MSGPTLTTSRLLLRPFTTADAPRVQELAGDIEVARSTANIPHPYEDGMAEAWIAGQAGRFQEGTAAVFAVTEAGGGRLVGATGLEIKAAHRRAELGYWIGRPYWGRGLATEAARAALAYGFTTLGLERIHAAHFGSNPASGFVMSNAGMRLEGTLRSHFLKWGQAEDLVVYGILRAEWSDQTREAQPYLTGSQ